jgi:hypothetical protein
MHLCNALRLLGATRHADARGSGKKGEDVWV